MGKKKQHNVLIKSFKSIMAHHTKHKESKEWCLYCLSGFTTKDVLAKPKENSISINGRQGVQMPKKGSKVQFQDHHRQMPVPSCVFRQFSIYVL